MVFSRVANRNEKTGFAPCLAVRTAMPKSPSGKKRPPDVASNAVHVMRIATGEINENGQLADGRNAAAVALGRLGGAARSKSLSKTKKRAIAISAAKKRWLNEKRKAK
jgi:hypothetical protein